MADLGTVRTHNFKDTVGKAGGFAHKGALSSAHLLRRSAADTTDGKGKNLTAGHVAMVMDAGLAAAEQRTTVEMFILPDDKPHERSTLTKYELPRGYVPYHHSFCLTATDVAVMPLMPMTVQMGSIIFEGKPFSAAFKPWDNFDKGNSRVYLVPLSTPGSSPIEFALDHPLWYVHVVNSFQFNSSTVVIDLSTFPNNAFLEDGANVQVNRDKAKRDADPNRAVIIRYAFNVDTKAVTRTPLKECCKQVFIQSPQTDRTKVRLDKFPSTLSIHFITFYHIHADESVLCNKTGVIYWSMS